MPSFTVGLLTQSQSEARLRIKEMRFSGIELDPQRPVRLSAKVPTRPCGQLCVAQLHNDKRFAAHQLSYVDAGLMPVITLAQRNLNVLRPNSQRHAFVRVKVIERLMLRGVQRQRDILTPETALRNIDEAIQKIHAG